METKVAQEAGEAVAKIAHMDVADKIFRVFGRLNSDARKGGLSLEDMAARTLTIFGVYLPQGIISIKENKHKWETNGRNALVWTMTVLLTYLLKNDKIGLNQFLDKFMQRQKPAAEATGFLEGLINRFRLKADYFDILKAAKVAFKEDDRKIAFWSKLDENELRKVNYLFSDLQEKAAKGVLEKGEKELLEALPTFIRRLNVFPVLATTLITAATVYLIGDVAMRIVYKFIAPFDHDYVPPDKAKKGKQNTRTVAISPSRQLSLHQPTLFQAFANGRGVTHA